MKKLKTRIKRALAGFCREELLEYIGYRHNYGVLPFGPPQTVHMLEFDTMVMEFTLDLNTLNRDVNRPERNIDYEMMLNNAKREMAEAMLEHIHVDTRTLTTREDFAKRSVHLSLRIQRKQKVNESN